MSGVGDVLPRFPSPATAPDSTKSEQAGLHNPHTLEQLPIGPKDLDIRDAASPARSELLADPCHTDVCKEFRAYAA
jgi:hypothetical protein